MFNTNPVLFFAPLMLGILGSLHCISMCGGIVGVLCYGCSHRQWMHLLFYNLGRIITYTLLGTLVGFSGFQFSQFLGPSTQVTMRGLTALAIIIAGVYLAGWLPKSTLLAKLAARCWRPFNRITCLLIPVSGLRQAFLLGGIWGLIPCGLVYMALLLALTSGSGLQGAYVMFFFGLGTLPAMLLLGVALQHYHTLLSKARLKPISGFVLMGFGVLSLIWLFLHLPQDHAQLACH